MNLRIRLNLCLGFYKTHLDNDYKFDPGYCASSWSSIVLDSDRNTLKCDYCNNQNTVLFSFFLRLHCTKSMLPLQAFHNNIHSNNRRYLHYLFERLYINRPSINKSICTLRGNGKLPQPISKKKQYVFGCEEFQR